MRRPPIGSKNKLKEENVQTEWFAGLKRTPEEAEKEDELAPPKKNPPDEPRQTKFTMLPDTEGAGDAEDRPRLEKIFFPRVGFRFPTSRTERFLKALETRLRKEIRCPPDTPSQPRGHTEEMVLI